MSLCMTNQELLEAFQVAYQNLQLQPLLTQEKLDQFWVEYETNVIDELEQLVEDSASGTDKIVFTGHRGCGKSTLLAKFAHYMADRHFVVFFSISDMIEASDVNHINILFAIAVQLMETAESQKVNIPASTRKKFYQWFSKHTKTELSSIEADLEASYETGGGFNIASIIKFLAQIKAKLKANAVIREEIKSEFARKISDLVDRVNEIAAAISVQVKQPLLVIIDDLDKLDLEVIETIYRNNIKPLFQPQFLIIYTIPIAAIRNLSVRNAIKGETNKIQQMRVAKFFPKGVSRRTGAEPIRDCVEAFQKVLHKRIPADLINPETEQELILNSGGVLRELMRLAARCCSKCLTQIRREQRKSGSETAASAIKIDAGVLEQAITDLRIEFAEPLGRSDYDLLNIIYQDNEPPDAENQRFLDLLHELYILDYRNAKLWYDLHPIVMDLLLRRE